jgi:hypothetical protein
MAFASGLVYMPEVNDRKSSALLSLAAGCLVVQVGPHGLPQTKLSC